MNAKRESNSHWMILSYNDDKDAIAAARRMRKMARRTYSTILTDKEKKRCQDMIKNEHLF